MSVDKRIRQELLGYTDGLNSDPYQALDSVHDKAARRRRDRATAVAVGVVAAVLLTVGLSTMGAHLLAGNVHQVISPAPVASLGRLAYGKNHDIYLSDASGKHPIRIANALPGGGPASCGYWGEGPIWSPDGRHLAYRGSAGNLGSCPGIVYISDALGHRVASFAANGWLISWSPDSTRVATWVRDYHTIGIYGLDGVRQALLTVPPGLVAPGDFSPVWSPDGASLMLPQGVEVPVDGSTPRQLPSDDPRSQWDVTYSLDGAWVAGVAYGYSGRQSLVVAKSDGSQARELIRGSVQFPAWSPTGDQIAFLGGGPNGRATELRVVDVATGTVTSLADMRGDMPMIKFSPEGDQILFSRKDANGVTSLWSIHTDGSDPHRLVAGASWGDWQAVSSTR